LAPFSLKQHLQQPPPRLDTSSKPAHSVSDTFLNAGTYAHGPQPLHIAGADGHRRHSKRRMLRRLAYNPMQQGTGDMRMQKQKVFFVICTVSPSGWMTGVNVKGVQQPAVLNIIIAQHDSNFSGLREEDRTDDRT
jgi:hypothetical protein